MIKQLNIDFGPEPVDIDLGRIPVGSTVTIRVSVRKNNSDGSLSPWPITTPGSSVVLKFFSPDTSDKPAISFTRTMNAVDAPNGVFEYVTTVDDIDVVGVWSIGLRVTDQRVSRAIVNTYAADINFEAICR